MQKLLILLLLFVGKMDAQTQGFANNADGSKTFYRVFGSGTPILIINGGPGMNSNGFEALARRLSETNKTILYDQRGTGKSTLSRIDGTTITMQLMVEDIESLRKHLKIDRWIILGHSFGGMLASYYATKHPDVIEKMILSSSGGIDLGLTDYVGGAINSKLSQTQRDSLQYFNRLIAKGDTTHKTRLGRGRMLAPAYIFNSKFIPLLAERLTQGNSTINQILWDDLRKIDFNCAPSLRNFEQPVLIIQGKQDIINIETAQIAHKAFQNSSIVLLERCGHYGWLDAEKEYFEAINTFLR